jgi:hypothetical protein
LQIKALYTEKLCSEPYYKRRALFIILPLLITFVFSCREIYYPVVDNMNNIVIVDGFVADQPGMSYIKLSTNKEDDNGPDPLRDAIIHISDEHGNISVFLEDRDVRPGHYYPERDFAGTAGRSYTLHIETEEGEIYESLPQKMLPAATVDSVYPEYATKQYLYTDHRGTVVKQNVPGIEVFITLSSTDDDVLRFRIEPTLLLLYNFYHFRLPDVDVYYKWKKQKLTDAPQINLRPFENSFSTVKNHLVSFLPTSNLHYDLSREEPIHRKIIIIRYYTLNDEAYRFHHEAYKQVSSENKLFDPVVSQLPTNIRCTSEPDKPVIGFFEVSSVMTGSYMLVEQSYDNIFEFIKVAGMEDVPDSGSLLNRKPGFWRD